MSILNLSDGKEIYLRSDLLEPRELGKRKTVDETYEELNYTYRVLTKLNVRGSPSVHDDNITS